MNTERNRTNAWVGAAAAAVVLLFLAVSVQKIWAGDFWGQLRTGQWILETLRVPVADDFSFTAAGREVREVRWLYCMLIAVGWKAGPWLHCIGQGAVLGAMWLVIVWPVRRVLRSPWAWLILALGIAGGAGRWVLRPELATDLFIAVFLVGLERARRCGRIGPAWGLIAVQALWVNLHSVYVFGPALAWLFAGSTIAERWLARAGVRVGTGIRPISWHGLILAAAVTGACWVNPYFHRGAMYAVEMWREAGGFVGEMLGEMRSPLSIPVAIWRWDQWCAVALTIVLVGTYAANWRRVGLARLGVLAVAVYLGATAQRNLPLLAIMGVWAGLSNLADYLDAPSTPVMRTGDRWRAWKTRSCFALVTIGSGFLAWYVATDRAWTSIGAPRETGMGVVEWDVPRGAADFVVNSGARPQVYNHMREGHYLGWRSGGRIKVFVDGRTDVFGDAFLREYMSTRAATWDVIAAKWGINAAIVPVRGYEELIGFLSRHKGWALVYLDHRNLVFVRDIPDHAGLIDACRIDPSTAWAAAGSEPSEHVEGWKRIMGGKARPWYSFGMAQSFLAVGSLENAARYLESTLDRFPTHERALAELAAVRRFTGRQADGDRVFARLRPSSEWARYSERTLAGRLIDAGRRDEAIAAMERAINEGENDPLARVTLGDWYFGAKNYAAARGQYEAAVKAGVDTAEDWKKLGFAREQAGELPAAAQAYERSLRCDANQHEVWYLMGLVQARRGDRTAARDSLERALRINPEYAAARKALDGLGRQ